MDVIPAGAISTDAKAVARAEARASHRAARPALVNGTPIDEDHHGRSLDVRADRGGQILRVWLKLSR
jgi:hypothetical protein